MIRFLFFLTCVTQTNSYFLEPKKYIGMGANQFNTLPKLNKVPGYEISMDSFHFALLLS